MDSTVFNRRIADFPRAGKCLIWFVCFYYGTEALIGIMAEGGILYSPWLAAHCNYPDLLRKCLLDGAGWVLQFVGYDVSAKGKYHLLIAGVGSIQLVYSCLGLGIISFWMAFVLSGNGSILQKNVHCFLGCLLIICINICRLILIGIAIAEHQKLSVLRIGSWYPLANWNHHLLFNICSYVLVCVLSMIQNREVNRTQKGKVDRHLF